MVLRDKREEKKGEPAVNTQKFIFGLKKRKEGTRNHKLRVPGLNMFLKMVSKCIVFLKGKPRDQEVGVQRTSCLKKKPASFILRTSLYTGVVYNETAMLSQSLRNNFNPIKLW